MSMDYYVYLKSLDTFSTEECKRFFLNYDMKADIHPDFDINTQSGFLPFKLELVSPEAPMKDKEFLTGFEFYLDDEYDYKADLKELQPKGLKGLFKKQKYLYSAEIDPLISDCKYFIDLNCGYEAFEASVAFGFAAYLVKNCGGIFYDPQDDRFITGFDEEYFKENIDSMNEFYQKEECEIHLFEKW